MSILGEVFGEQDKTEPLTLKMGTVEMRIPGGAEILEYNDKVFGNLPDDTPMWEIVARLLKDWSANKTISTAPENELGEELHEKMLPVDWQKILFWYTEKLGATRDDMRAAMSDPDFQHRRKIKRG